MSDEIRLACWVEGDDCERVFSVRVKLRDTVAELRKAIRAERPSFQALPADSLKPRKFEVLLETFDNDSAGLINLEDGQEFKSWMRLSKYWKEEPPVNILSVIVPRPAGATLTPSPSETLSQNSPPDWLVEMHDRLWGKHDLFDQIFRSVNLTKTDFIELQSQLQNFNPSRSSESYVAMNVLDVKSDFLRSRNSVGISSSSAKLIPRVVVDTSGDVNPFIDNGVMDDNSMDSDMDDDMDVNAEPHRNDIPCGLTESDPPRVVVDAPKDLTSPTDTGIITTDVAGTGAVDYAMEIVADSHPNSLSYIDADAALLSEGPDAIFPCSIRYLDLTFLKLKNLVRVPHLMLIRDEWREVVDIFNKRKSGIRGSAVYTGAPGIGKTCLMYKILTLCLILAQPIVFQDKGGKVYIIDDKVRREKGKVDVPGDDVLTLVDADGSFCIPDPYLLDAVNLRILLASSPRNRKDRSWLEQSIRDVSAVFVMEPWTRRELLVTSLFLEGSDITLARFQVATRICGHIPRRCFDAVLSPEHLFTAEDVVVRAIKATTNLAEVIVHMHSGQPVPHCAFEVFPSPITRSWESCWVRPVSDWAFSQMVVDLDRRGADAAYDFYQVIQGTSYGATLGGKIFEAKVHKFFESITMPRRFRIRSLDDCSTSFDIEFSSSVLKKTFGPVQMFAGHLTSSVKAKQSCYLKPLSGTFPTFDSFLYQHGMSVSGCQPLLGLQITAAYKHLISIKGLKSTQRGLNRRIPELEALRPTKTAKWPILFVVPEPMAASFVKQGFKDAANSANWSSKTTQYVVGLPESEVLRTRVELVDLK